MSSPLIDTGAFIEHLRSIEEHCAGNLYLRRAELSRLRDEYISVRIATKLGERQANLELSESDLKAVANRILAKAGSKAASADDGERRTQDEERLVGAAKVAWHKLLRAQGLAPARPWSRATTKPTKGRRLRRQIAKASKNSEQATEEFQRYVAKQALHLLNACEEARALDAVVVSPGIEQTIAALYTLCIANESPRSSNDEQK